jgi:Uma2 family endonuclease
MSRVPIRVWTLADYDRAAAVYLAQLPLEHFMEGVAQAKQREIAVSSLALLRPHRPDLHLFNELLIQYFHKGRLRQLVPDNMAVISEQPCEAVNSFNLEREPAGPFLVMEWVSDSPKGRRKDYKDNRRKFEKELKVPYFVTYDPARQDLRVLRHNGTSYEPVEPNEQGRYPIPELELEIGLLDGWVRFWFRGELLPLPAELQGEVEALQGQLEEWRGQAEQERVRADQQQELAAQEKQRADQERQVAEQEKQRAEQEKQRADQERQVAEQEKQRADDLAAQVQELLKRLGAGPGDPPKST